MQRSDEELLHASLNGEPEAFGQLVLRYEHQVFSLIHRLNGRAHEAQDLFQTVWAQAFAGRASFRQRSKFSTWLYAIALNRVRDWQRREVRQGKRRGELEVEPADPRPGLLDRLLKRDQEDQIRRALRTLRPSDQEILALRYLQGLEYSEVAAITGKRLGPLRVQMHRALRSLKDAVEKDEAKR